MKVRLIFVGRTFGGGPYITCEMASNSTDTGKDTVTVRIPVFTEPFQIWSKKFIIYVRTVPGLRAFVNPKELDLHGPDDLIEGSVSLWGLDPISKEARSRDEAELDLYCLLSTACDRHDVAHTVVLEVEGVDNVGTRAFQSLKERFRPNGRAQSMYAFASLMTKRGRFQPGDTVADYITRHCRLHTVIKAGNPAYALHDDMKISAIVMGLSDEFKGWADAIERDILENKSSLTFNSVCDSLMQYSLREEIKGKIAQLDVGDSLSSNTSFMTQAPQRGRRIPTCHNCDQPGHVSYSCTQAKHTCNTCGEVGHLEKHCQTVHDLRRKRAARGNQRGGANGAPQGAAASGLNMFSDFIFFTDFDDERCFITNEGKGSDASLHDDVARAFSTYSKKGPLPSDNLYYDTCASSHMMNNLNLFDEGMDHSIEGNVLGSVGGAKQALGRGAATVPICGTDGTKTCTFRDTIYCPDLCANLVSHTALKRMGCVLLEGTTGVRLPGGQILPLSECEVTGFPCFKIAAFKSAILTDPVPPAEAYALQTTLNAASLALTPVQQRAQLLHRRLCHLSPSGMRIAGQHTVGMKLEGCHNHVPFCEACAVMKSTMQDKSLVFMGQEGDKSSVPTSSYEAQRDKVKTAEDIDRHHADIWGPVQTPSFSKETKMLGIVHVGTGLLKIYALVTKDTDSIIKRFQQYTANIMTVNHLRTDSEAVFDSDAFNTYCAQSQIQLTHSAPNRQHQNGKAERALGVIANSARTLLYDANLPDQFWAYAMDTAAVVRNRLPYNAGPSPTERYTKRRPDLSRLRVFGCKAYVHVHPARRKGGKLAERARPGIFVGYAPNGWKVWIPHDWEDIQKGGIELISLDVTFDETWRYTLPGSATVTAHSSASDVIMQLVGQAVVHPGHAAASTTLSEPDASPADPPHVAVPQPQPDEPISGSNTLQEAGPPHVGGPQLQPDNPISDALQEAGGWEDLSDMDISSSESEVSTPRARTKLLNLQTGAFEFGTPDSADSELIHDGSNVDDHTFYTKLVSGYPDLTDEPRTEHEALNRPDGHMFLDSLIKECNSLKERNVYKEVRLADVPRNRALLDCKPVFKIKRLANGDVDKYKTRIVARGDQMVYGRDYTATYSPVSRLTTVRMIIALGTANAWDFLQFDVETAFLNADLDEEIYMRPPQGFRQTNDSGDSVVWRLLKALYGLKQAGRKFWINLRGTLTKDCGFQQSAVDPCLFLCRAADGELIAAVAMHVDDGCLAVTGSAVWVDGFKQKITARYNVSFGPLEWCLGISVTHTPTHITLTQTQYILDTLNRFGMSDCNPARVPMSPGTVICKSQCPQWTDGKGTKSNLSRYREITGCLLHLANNTRPDISVAVSLLCSVNHNPAEGHFAAAKHVLRYLKGTSHLGLAYSKSPHLGLKDTLIGYVDADHAGEKLTSKSRTGYAFLLNGAAISWHSKVQTLVCTSTQEAEYVALCHAGCEAVHLRNLITELGFQPSAPTTINEDNQGALRLSTEQILNTKSKHIPIRYHKIRELVDQKHVLPVKVHTNDNAADLFTKNLAFQKFGTFRQMILGTPE